MSKIMNSLILLSIFCVGFIGSLAETEYEEGLITAPEKIMATHKHGSCCSCTNCQKTTQDALDELLTRGVR